MTNLNEFKAKESGVTNGRLCYQNLNFLSLNQEDVRFCSFQLANILLTSKLKGGARECQKDV